ncbi:NAD(P)H-dependent oxidoreductase [Acanthopleuribacter pedis]|uniref:NAD(P)H-dependent oxidoreductase n=1 Tax=Acanthopleuribacter pedis TaxID=442870 RepID=A0A8J7Q5Q8_9BACT|nr:NAD(P)H-dependent oxidoreductase [Acanthopleuribacter pedis]MBO1319575.1 NAD(P)H-dependent oxidoreductase [Acanthopleuribacter pedis]
MNVLMVIEPHESPAFSERMKDTALDLLTSQGHEVHVVSFHDEAMVGPPRRGFVPGLLETEPFNQQPLRQAFHSERTLRHPLQQTVNQVDPFDWADVVLFQFPLWWFLSPPTLRQFRCRVGEWCRHRGESRRIRKRAMLVFTTPSQEPLFGGREREVSCMLRPLQEDVLYRAGFDVLAPFIAWGVDECGEWERADMLRDYVHRVARLTETEPVFTHRRPIPRPNPGRPNGWDTEPAFA